MSQNFSEQFLNEGQQARHRLLDLLNRMFHQAKAFEIPPPDKALADAHAHLTDDTYQLMVAGEVKRGKTTLVNALTGLKLPEDVDVATCQAFRIQHGAEVSYRVRYEDESTIEIDASQLGRYGSQVVVDDEGIPDPGKTIRWIEVTVPYPDYLAKNLVLLDTPGVGGVNIAHEEITHRFLPHADAVIFVLDSERPIDNLETQFLGDILDTTRHIFFVQTKIDLFKEADWQAILAKSQSILLEKFGNKLLDHAVLPLSSRLLQKASTGDEFAEVRLVASRHRDFALALSRFVYRVVGWSRAADAVLLAEPYYQDCGGTLSQRYQSLADESRQEAEKFRQRLQQTMRSIENKTSTFNRTRNKLVDRLRDAGRTAMHGMEDSLLDAELDCRHQIDQVKSTQDAQVLAEKLPEYLQRTMNRAWRQTHSSSLHIYRDCLSELAIVAESELRSTDRDPNWTPSNLPSFATSAMDRFLDRANVVRNHALSTAFVASLSLGALVAAGVLTAAIAVPLGAIATVVGVFTGMRASGRPETSASKSKLQQYLDVTMRSVRTTYLRAVDEQFRTLEREFQEHIERLVAQKREEADAELTRLQEQERMTKEQRADGAIKLNKQSEAWRQYNGELSEISLQLDRLYERVAPPSAKAE